jgi:hypothetical protein
MKTASFLLLHFSMSEPELRFILVPVQDKSCRWMDVLYVNVNSER